MRFQDLRFGQRFLHFDQVAREWFYFRKLDDTHAQPIMPAGQSSGHPATFYANEEVRPEL